MYILTDTNDSTAINLESRKSAGLRPDCKREYVS